MGKRQRVRVPRPTLPKVSSLEEAESFLGLLADHLRSLVDVQNRQEEELAAVRACFSPEIQILERQIGERVKALYLFAQAARQEIFPENEKTLSLKTGELAFRDAPAAIRFLKDEASVLAEIKARGGDWAKRFVQTIERVKKQALLDDPEDAAKLKTVQRRGGGERFYVRPKDVPFGMYFSGKGKPAREDLEEKKKKKKTKRS